MENKNQQMQQIFQEQNRLQEHETNALVCKHCGAPLEEDQLFCSECGEKVGGEERICKICKTSTTSEFCPNCGSRVIPLICPNCGKESFSDFCDDCGTLLSKDLQQFLEQPAQEIQQMSQAEAEQIKNEAEKSITPELKQFLKKIEEHRILLEEREYFNKREKRIVKVFGQNPFELIEQSPEEKAFMTKMYEGLRKTVVERRNKEINDKLKQLFPDLEEDSKFEEEQKQKAEQLRLENEAKRAEMEKRYNELLSNVTNEVQKAKLAEQKRLEEERLRKEAEERERRRKEQEERERRESEEKERRIKELEVQQIRERNDRERLQRERERLILEQEARANAILGEYVGSLSRKTEYLKINSRSNNVISGVLYSDFYSNGNSYEIFTGIINGNSIRLRVNRLIDETSFSRLNMYQNFNGTFINDCTIKGYWTSRGNSIINVTYYKY